MSSSSSFDIDTVSTKPFSGQKPGTSGLRKKVTEVQQPHYLENFVQCIFDSLPSNELSGSTLVVSGDGRFYNDEAVRLIFRMAAANGVTGIILGENALVSTPAVSGLIRSKKAYGGIILTASHNPGGPTEDFGIKYNCSNGGPAPESVTDLIYKKTTTISQYKIAKQIPNVDITKIGVTQFGPLKIEVIDATLFYADLMKSIFDFNKLKEFVARKDFKMIYDSMNGVAGPFAKKIFIHELGAAANSVMNSDPKPDFGGAHPDPNLTYAHDLVERMGLGSHSHSASSHDSTPDFGAAADGDADRNMILGNHFFVTPSDSVAIIAAHSSAIPYFKSGLKGVARSMPTSAALDRVAEKLGMKCFEVPTGWKFFGNLMDDNKLSICGEESFGTGSDHIREKDGMWAVLAWLSILQQANEGNTGKLVSVKDIVTAHWKKFGRNYYSRYDYESVDSASADKVMNTLLELVNNKNSVGVKMDDYTVAKADEFEYKDPVDHSISAHQGIRIVFSDGSRIVFRLSGTGSVGATIRVYIEKYEADASKLDQETADALKPLIKIALEISKMKELTGREKPTVIT